MPVGVSPLEEPPPLSGYSPSRYPGPEMPPPPFLTAEQGKIQFLSPDSSSYEFESSLSPLGHRNVFHRVLQLIMGDTNQGDGGC